MNDNPTDRAGRRRARRVLIAAVVALALVATACGDSKSSSSASSSSSSKDLGKLSLRLSWIKNSEFAGSYVADNKGFYKANGFSSVDLIAGGPSAQPTEVDVQSGKALVGISAPDLVGAAVTKGADLVIIGAQYQKNPFAVMSLAKNPIKTPQDMYGKSFGLQSVNQPVWDAFVKASGIDDSKIKKIPAQFDPQPLVNGEADTWFSFVTNEPNLLKVKGIDTYSFLLADFGYPLVSEVYVVKRESLTKYKDQLKAFLKSEIQGWTEVYKDPALGAQLTTDVYGKDLGLDKAEQELEVRSENNLIWTDDTKANGIFTVTDKLVQENIDVLVKGGLKVDKKLFDFTLLNEVYKENPDLKKAPTSVK
jgi:ABC-type nitrate/sulfonate/bicarbonate transport system substrate-binding protein